MPLLELFYSLLGLIIGSFLNVCIYRIPRRESIVTPGSRCPRCQQPVRPYDNVPVLSFIWLGGKCRFCKERIPLRYPIVELLTAGAFYACARVWHFSSPTFVNSLFLSLIIMLVFIDYDHQILPDVLTKPGILLGIILSPFQSGLLGFDAFSYKLAYAIPSDDPEIFRRPVSSILGAVVGSGMLYITALGYEILRKKKGLGLGDVKMMGMVGAFLGWPLAILTVFGGSVLGSILGMFLILFKGKTLQTKLAFGTFLGAAAAISLFFGVSFIRWYANRVLGNFS